MRLQCCHLVFDNKMIRFPLVYKDNPDIWGGNFEVKLRLWRSFLAWLLTPVLP